MSLVCFCYGSATMNEEKDVQEKKPLASLCASNLQELREQLNQSRLERQEQVRNWLAQTPAQQFELDEEERFLSFRLHTVTSKNFAGQIVEEEGNLVYASLFAKPRYLYQKA